MNDASDITDHYTSGDLLARLEASLREDGVEPSHATAEALAPYDHFHGRGLEATEEMAAAAPGRRDRPYSGCRQRSRRARALPGPALRLPCQRDRSDGRILRRRAPPDGISRA